MNVHFLWRLSYEMELALALTTDLYDNVADRISKWV